MAMIDQLSEYLVRARTADLPAEVARKGKHHILDTLAAMVSALGLRPGRLALRYARSQRGVRESIVVGSGNIMALPLRLPWSTESSPMRTRPMTPTGLPGPTPAAQSYPLRSQWRKKKTAMAGHCSTLSLPVTI